MRRKRRKERKKKGLEKFKKKKTTGKNGPQTTLFYGLGWGVAVSIPSRTRDL